MVLHRASQPTHALTYHDILWIVLLAGAVILVVVALNMAFGMPVAGPSFQIVPDPAGPLPY
jgi:hypothetical protein